MGVFFSIFSLKQQILKKVMRKYYVLFLSVFLIVFILTTILVPLNEIINFDGDFLISYDDIENVNKNKTFGGFYKVQLNEKQTQTADQKTKQGEIVFKLFGVIPIKKVGVVLFNDEDFYVGGVPIGLSINTNGAIVVSEENDIETPLKEGDIITSINGNPVEDLSSISQFLDEDSKETEVEFLRKNKKYKTLIKTLKDENSGKLKLGLLVKDGINGVGTLTYVNKKTHEYGALGHPIVEENGGNIVPVLNGSVHECALIGINKGKKNDPGELKCVFSSWAKSKGNILSNSKFGINGTLNDLNGLVDENITAKLGGRLGVKMGKAFIVSSISGIREEYEIEIIKANYQKSADDKSIVFRVKDKRLLDLTGGIVQGMSGSPIVQDGKIIGAVTHVFLNDPTKGYAVYVDWMI